MNQARETDALRGPVQLGIQHKATASNCWCWRENGNLSRHELTIAATSARAFIAAHKGAENQEPGNDVVALMQPCFAFQRAGKAWSGFPRRNGALKGLRELYALARTCKPYF